MLTQVTAIRFDKRMNTGRTKPAILTCTDENGAEVELVVKLMAGCDMKPRSLVAETIAAVLAADLDIPAPEPFLVMVSEEFASIIPDATIRDLAMRSIGWNFGSMKLPPGYSILPVHYQIGGELLNSAAEIFAFDIFIANPDRRRKNPNFLFNGKQLAIFDHELALLIEGTLGWKRPWEDGSLDFCYGLRLEERHVFMEELRGRAIDLSRFKNAFDIITDKRLKEYRDALPQEWECSAVDEILNYLAALKLNLDAAIINVKKALR